jgi:hypothetical protein
MSRAADELRERTGDEVAVAADLFHDLTALMLIQAPGQRGLRSGRAG